MKRVITKAVLLCCLAVLCLTAGGCTGRQSSVEYVIGVSLANLSEQWRLVLKEELEEEAEKYEGITLVFADATNDSDKQTADVKRLMEYGIDLLIISPTDVEKMTPLVSRVYAEIPVIVLDRAVEGFDYTLFIGPDNELIGQQAGQEVNKLIEQEGLPDARVLELMTNSYACQKRSDTFAHTVKETTQDRMQILLIEETRDCAEDTLVANAAILEKIDVIFAHNDYVAYGARRALDQLGFEHIKIVGLDGFEGEDGGLEMVRNGVINATVTCPTGGREAIKNAIDILNDVSGIPKQIILRSASVNAGNVVSFLAEKETVSVKETKEIRVSCIQAGDEGGWRKANQESIKEAAKEFDIQLELIVTEQSLEEQITKVRDCIAQKVDVIVITPVVEDGWEEVLLEAKEAGIPIILSDRKISASVDMYTAFLGAEFAEEGKRCGNWLMENVDGGADGVVQILELQGTKGASPTIERKQGFAEAIKKNPDCRIVYSDFGDYNQEGGKRIVREYLNNHEWDIDAIYAHNDDMALGAAEVLKENGIKPGEDVKIISIDGTAEGLSALKKGEINCIAECNPILGNQLMKAITDLMKGNELPLRIITDERLFTEDTPAYLFRNRKY